METPLHELLYSHLIKHSVQKRRLLFDILGFYVRDTTFINHARNMDVSSDASIRLYCDVLYGFNNQPGLREQVTRWLTEGLEHRI